MARLERIVQQLGNRGESRPYYPFYAALQKGILNPREQSSYASQDPPGVELAAGAIPNVKGAGIRRAGDEFAAFDHARISVEDDELLIEPTSKNDITKDGRISGEGAIVFERESGRLNIAAFVIDVVRHPYQLEAFGREGFSYMNRVGHLAVISTALAGLPEYEVSEIDMDSGNVRAQAIWPRRG